MMLRAALLPLPSLTAMPARKVLAAGLKAQLTNSRAASAIFQRIASLDTAGFLQKESRRSMATEGGNKGSSEGADTHGPPPPPPPSFFSSPIGWMKANKAHFKDLFKRYGYLTVATYLAVYVLTLAGLYGLVLLGVVKGPDVNAYVNDWTIKKLLVGDKHVSFPPRFIDFGTAWVMTKMTEPIRLAVTIAIMPRVIRRAPPALLKFFKASPPAAAAATAANTTTTAAAARGAGDAASKLK